MTSTDYNNSLIIQKTRRNNGSLNLGNLEQNLTIVKIDADVKTRQIIVIKSSF